MNHHPNRTSLSGQTGKLDPITQAIGDHVSGTLSRDLSGALLEKTRDHLIDTVAAIVSGSRLPAGEAGLRYAETLGGLPQATVAGSSHRTNVVNAAQANAMAGHGDETDDFHVASITHPGCAVVPAALAIAEAKGHSGLDLIKAVAVGYDICGAFPSPSTPTDSSRQGAACTRSAACSAPRQPPHRCFR